MVNNFLIKEKLFNFAHSYQNFKVKDSLFALREERNSPGLLLCKSEMCRESF